MSCVSRGGASKRKIKLSLSTRGRSTNVPLPELEIPSSNVCLEVGS